MNNAFKQMAAISAALRVLMANDPLIKPADVLIGATNELTQPLIEMMMEHAANHRSIILAIFRVEGATALLEKVMVVDGTTKKGQIYIGAGKFVQKADGSFSILSHNQREPYEYTFFRNGRRLKRALVVEPSGRAMMELRGLQALLSTAAMPACQAEAIGASATSC